MPVADFIKNRGEYYNSHYLETNFENDVQSIVKDWKDSQAPHQRLPGRAELYFRAKQAAVESIQLSRESDAERENEFYNGLWSALGFGDVHSETMELAGRGIISVRGVVRRNNEPHLVLLQGAFLLPETARPDGHMQESAFDLVPPVAEIEGEKPAELEDMAALISAIFGQENAARWILYLAGGQLFRLDRHTWAEGRYIEINLDDAFAIAKPAEFRQIAVLVSHPALVPLKGEAPAERFEDGSHRFAAGVTEKLQFAVREAIEFIANEWVESRRLANQGYSNLSDKEDPLPDGSRTITAERLHHESLLYVYRLLFCLFAESRGAESGLLPVSDDAYRQGYSLEALRDLEDAPLDEEAREGHYFHEHMKQLFALIAEGTPETEYHDTAYAGSRDAFVVRPLTASLFDPDETVLLDRARLRNEALQKVIQRLSLSESTAGKGRGRVNYARLGINQLGAVYEGLLSYHGRFIEENMLHVKPAKGDFKDNKTQTYFVPLAREKEFKTDEIEHVEVDSAESYKRTDTRKKKVRVYRKGEFVLHLTGVERERTASYYTPEVLSRTLVREAIEELFETRGDMKADEILTLKLCEPAMGSGAFLNEAAEELGRRYLIQKQKETGDTIDPERFPDELGRVRHFIATRNIYGVDLNPMAVELGSLSLWLGSMHRLREQKSEAEELERAPDRFRAPAVPWFGLRLRNGNSLVGARRAVWKASELREGKHHDHDFAPRVLGPGEVRKDDEVYHFLVLDDDSAPIASDKLFKNYFPEGAETARRHVREFRSVAWQNPETRKDGALLRTALAISKLTDAHWNDYTKERLKALQETQCTASVWPLDSGSKEALVYGPGLKAQEKIKAELETKSSSFQRLKLLMDLWCALYYWPATHPDEALLMPSQEGFLAVAQLLLGGIPSDAEDTHDWMRAMLGLDLSKVKLASGDAKKQLPDVDALTKALPWYEPARKIADEEHFFHWELVFPEIIGPHEEARGFDLMLGNPPWITAGWQDAQALGEIDAKLGVRGAKSATYNKERDKLLKEKAARVEYFREFRRSEGGVVFMNSPRMYPELRGIRMNLYKNFLVRFWTLLGKTGVGSILHEEGIFDDARGGQLRSEYFGRLRRHYQFQNKLLLFTDVSDQRFYSLNVFGGSARKAAFDSITMVFHPRTIGECRDDSRSSDPVPGIKNGDGDWELSGHPSRLVQIGEAELKLFARLYNVPEEEWQETKLPQVHSKELLSVLEKIADAPEKLGDHAEEYYATDCFNETNAQRDGAIVRQEDPSYQPKDASEWILTGPQLYVATPFYQSARSEVVYNSHYDPIDLTEIPEDFLPRSPYKPGKSFAKKLPKWNEKPVTEFWKLGWRKMASLTGERTLIASLLPPIVTHIDGLSSLASPDFNLLFRLSGTSLSLLGDMSIRTVGAANIRVSVLRNLPLTSSQHGGAALKGRLLRLMCLSGDYEGIWKKESAESKADSWTINDPRLTHEFEHPWEKLNPKRWDWKTPLRSDFARRLALLEIDVLVAQGLGLTLDELQTIYRVQFPVLQQYEGKDEYDAKGRRLPNTERKDPGGKELRSAREERKEAIERGKASAEDPITIEYDLDAGKRKVSKTFCPPFAGVNRENEYALIWKEFERRLG